MAFLIKLPRANNNVLLLAILACMIFMMTTRGGSEERVTTHTPESAMQDTEIRVPRRELQKIVQSAIAAQNSLKPHFNIARKIAYISRHVGTTADFKYMADNLQLENVDYFHPEEHNWYGYSELREKYLSINKNGIREKLCTEYDAIFISDSLSDGWGYLVDGPKCKNIVFIVTNRFDYGVHWKEREEFLKDFNFALNRNDDQRIRVIANNPFEYEYMKNRGVSFPGDIPPPVIRPFGYTTIEEKPEPIDAEKCIIINRVEQDTVLLNLLMKEKMGVECKIIDWKYGGPRTLSKYESIVVHLPYQVSIMKMWENLAYGILTAIPTPRFFTEICTQGECREARDVFETKKVVGEEKWTNYVEYYDKEWEQCFIQFDNWDQLKNLLESRDYQKNINACRNKMMDLRDKNLKAWKAFLDTLN